MILSTVLAALLCTSNALTFAPKAGSTGTDVAYVFMQGASSPAVGYTPVVE